MDSADSSEVIKHCPKCGGRPVVTFSTGWRVCGDCEERWHEETGETHEQAVKAEYEQLFADNETIVDRLRGLFK